MTDPISPAEAAAASAIDANLAQNANSDLAGTPEPTEQELADKAHALEAQLAAIQARKAAAGQGVPHQHIVPTADEHKATDVPTVHAGTTAAAAAPVTQVLPSSPAPLPAKVVTPSALLAEKLAAGAKPVKRKYAYQRNRK